MHTNESSNDTVIVMKFGGTSVRSEEARSSAIKHIRKHTESGKKLVVVVSAMGRKGEPYATDTLIELLKDEGEPINAEELDKIMSIGETLSSVFFSHLLNQNGLPAQSFTGRQAGILTDDNPGNSEILKINPARIIKVLNKEIIAVVAGFQGATHEGDVRTLGRGGSDTTAVALGVALNAKRVEIYSDVDGVAICDPKKITSASFVDSISANQILTMANEGSSIIHPRAVRESLKTKTTIVARNTFSDSPGTEIFHNEKHEKRGLVTLTHKENMILITTGDFTNMIKKVPEIIRVDKYRFLSKNDIYLEKNLKLLRKYANISKVEESWATISVVFDDTATKVKKIKEAEIIPSSKNVIRYLLKEEYLDSSLKVLFDQYIAEK